MKNTVFADTAPLRETDLALERRRVYLGEKGVLYKEGALGDIHLSALTVASGTEGTKAPMGRTLSLSLPSPLFWSEDARKDALRALRLAFAFFFPALPRRLLVAALGNRRLTADSLGPLTADKIEVSAALPEAVAAQFGLGSQTRVAVCVPDVFSKTGLESVRTVEAAVGLFHADALLVFDALAAKDKERLLRVIEITDTGTVPGGGVKRGTLALSEESLGIPVVAVGVPTVVRADGEHFLVARDMEDGIDTLSSLLAEATNLTFGGAPPLSDPTVDALFTEAGT